MYLNIDLFVFFFQAEDGIRDIGVTGVQTCALPISMRHMGLNYFKAFAMYVAVQLASFVAGVVISIATSPFDMPFIGNVPGRFIGGFVTFYTSLVVACILGLSLFKSADRLGIELDA